VVVGDRLLRPRSVMPRRNHRWHLVDGSDVPESVSRADRGPARLCGPRLRDAAVWRDAARPARRLLSAPRPAAPAGPASTARGPGRAPRASPAPRPAPVQPTESIAPARTSTFGPGPASSPGRRGRGIALAPLTATLILRSARLSPSRFVRAAPDLNAIATRRARRHRSRRPERPSAPTRGRPRRRPLAESRKCPPGGRPLAESRKCPPGGRREVGSLTRTLKNAAAKTMEIRRKHWEWR
jgi:hypothetical protein